MELRLSIGIRLMVKGLKGVNSRSLAKKNKNIHTKKKCGNENRATLQAITYWQVLSE